MAFPKAYGHASMKFSALEGRRVALWGYGREGRAALQALRRRLPDLPLTLLCSHAEAIEAHAQWAGLETCTDEVSAAVLTRFDVVIKSPGISPYAPAAQQAHAQGVHFTSGTALWFAENPQARTLCVTGTKGKSTTSALLAHLLRQSGHRTALVGNIGMPLLELLDLRPEPEIWVIELSSYQTADAIAPEVALVLNLFPEHLDWHGDQERYWADKLALATTARPRHLVLDAQNPELIERTRQSTATISYFNTGHGWHLRDHMLYRGTEAVLDSRPLALPGRHNRINLCAALAVLEAAGFDACQCAPHALSFQPLPHRLQRLGCKNGREYINDSISTTPHAALAALAHHAGQRVAILVGGYDRGLDWDAFFQHAWHQPPVAIITMGQNGPQIAAGLRRGGAPCGFVLHEAADLEQAVNQAEAVLGHDGIVLLSPGAPSFPAYRDYVERGRHFARLAGFDPDQISTIPGLGV